MSKEKNLSYYLSKYDEIKNISFSKQIKIGILSSFTINGLAETLKVKCSENNIECNSFVGGYNQYHQEILSKNSSLYKFNPDLVFLLIDIRSLFSDIYNDPYSLSLDKRKTLLHEKLDEIRNLLKIFAENSNSKLIINNLVIPDFSPYGVYETKLDFGFYEMITEFNSKLISMLKDKNNFYVYDFNLFNSKFGQKNIFNFKNYFFGDIQIDFDYIPKLAHELMSYVIAFSGLTKKCIVLDLDNTLWGGIVGEDGYENIKLGPQSPGNAFLYFQKTLKALKNRGIILAVNSKNNFDDAMKVINEHPHMILRKTDFSCMKINWNDKSENMKEISKELNIGLDSMVFFDDDNLNCEYISKSIPQIKVVNLSGDPSYFSEILQDLNDFNVLKITSEDLQKTQMYNEQKQREELKNSGISLDDFLSDLDMKITIKKSNAFTIPRISQLTLKTNQFNLTTKRYQEEEIQKFTDDKNFLVGCVQVQDKFGDNGITGVFIVKKISSDEWYLDTFLLSCRIMGREIETAMLNYIFEEAKKNNIKKIIAQFIPTQKNKPAENFLSQLGFTQNGEKWVYNLQNSLKLPKFLNIDVEHE